MLSCLPKLLISRYDCDLLCFDLNEGGVVVWLRQGALTRHRTYISPIAEPTIPT